ncbi:MAG: hypothetical protein JRD93_19505 [Deltaproteobacteria bacterium]|nr:hypothetical protein [Deltaproteobacteria bacterium]
MVTQKSIRNHPNDNHPSDYILLKLPFMTGMSPIAKATLRSLALWAVVADTQELRTAPHDAALPFLFIREQTQMGGF